MNNSDPWDLIGWLAEVAFFILVIRFLGIVMAVLFGVVISFGALLRIPPCVRAEKPYWAWIKELTEEKQ